jgi:hypothetical protein
MTVQIEFWQLMTFLIGLAITGITSLVGVARWWAQQSDNRLDERLQTLDNARKSDARRWDERFADLLSQKEFISALERDFLRFQAELPLSYVRREDYVRNQTVIEAKLDAVALKIENLQLKGVQS